MIAKKTLPQHNYYLLPQMYQCIFVDEIFPMCVFVLILPVKNKAMTTLKISVKSKDDANMLISMLQKMSIVQHIEQIETSETQQNQRKKLSALLKKRKPKKMFSEITDPVDWQRGLRDEWR